MSQRPRAAGLLLVYLIALMIVISIVLTPHIDGPWIAAMAVSALSMGIVITIIAPKIGCKVEIRDLLTWGSRREWQLALIWWVGLDLFRLGWVSLGTLVHDYLGTQVPIPEMSPPSGGLDWAAFVLTLIVVAPVLEELVFRGAVLKLFRDWGPRWAILASAFLFAWMHGSLFRLFPDLLGAVFLGFLVVRFGSITMAIAFHGLNNLFALGMLAAHTMATCPLCALGNLAPLILLSGALLWVVAFRRSYGKLASELAALWREGEEGVGFRSGLYQLLAHPSYKILLVILLLQTVAELLTAGGFLMPG